MRNIPTYFKVLCLIILAVVLVRCTTPGETPGPDKPQSDQGSAVIIGDGHDTVDQVYIAEWSNPLWTKAWLETFEAHEDAIKAIPAPKDMSKYCPKYHALKTEDKKQFFLTLFIAAAYRESAWKPDTAYTESFKDSKGKYVISRGLYQLSPESANQKAYGCGVATDGHDLHDPSVNIHCAGNIFFYWFKKDGYIGQTVGGSNYGGARYWSVFRNSSGSQAYIQGKTKALRFCN